MGGNDGFEPLKAKHDVTKLDFIVHDLGALEIIQRIQVMGFLPNDKLFIVSS